MSKIIPTIRPTYKQHLAYLKLQDKITRFILFGGGAEGGKSWFGAEWLLTNCYFYPGTKWFLGRNELTRLMGSSYATFRKVCEHHKIPQSDWRLNGQYHYIEFFNGSRIDLIDLAYKPSDPMFQRFGSLEYTGGWIEEAGEIHFMAFDMLKSRIGRWKNIEYGLIPAKILLTCNPEQNWLYRIIYKPWKKGMLPPEYAFIQALWNDNPYTAKEAGDRLDQITDTVLRMRLKMGLWEYSTDENSLLDYDAITDLFTNVLAPIPLQLEKKYLTADVARHGSDKIVLGNWTGLDLTDIKWKVNRDITATAEDIKLNIFENQIPRSQVIADDDGVGGGVVDIVKGIKGFIGNASPLVRAQDAKKKDIKERKQNFGNLRSQCGFTLADYINERRIRISADLDEPTKEMIIEDLQQLKKKDSAIEAPLRLISKEDIKEVLGRSPDFSDMMMMRMFFEFAPKIGIWKANDPGGIAPTIPGLKG